MLLTEIMERKLFNQTERVEVQVIRERTTLDMETFIQALKAEKPVVLYVVGVGDLEQFRQPLYKIIWYGERQLTFVYLGEAKTESVPSTWTYEEFYNTVEPMRLVYDKRLPCSPR